MGETALKVISKTFVIFRDLQFVKALGQSVYQVEK